MPAHPVCMPGMLALTMFEGCVAVLWCAVWCCLQLLTQAAPRGPASLPADPGPVLALACHVVMVQAGFQVGGPPHSECAQCWQSVIPHPCSNHLMLLQAVEVLLHCVYEGLQPRPLFTQSSVTVASSVCHSVGHTTAVTASLSVWYLHGDTICSTSMTLGSWLQCGWLSMACCGVIWLCADCRTGW